MSDDKKQVREDETPTQKKIRALVRTALTGDIQFETVIPQALITLLVVGGWVYMMVSGQTIPDTLSNILFVIVGFYFGSDYQYRRSQKAGK